MQQLMIIKEGVLILLSELIHSNDFQIIIVLVTMHVYHSSTRVASLLLKNCEGN